MDPLCTSPIDSFVLWSHIYEKYYYPQYGLILQNIEFCSIIPPLTSPIYFCIHLFLYFEEY